MAVSHIFDLPHNLQSVIHSANHVIKTVGNKIDLFPEVGVRRQRVNGNAGELGENLESARSLLEQPFLARNQVIILKFHKLNYI